MTELRIDAPNVPQFDGRVIGACSYAWACDHRQRASKWTLTACHDGGISIKFHHIDLCQVSRYPADRISGGHIPKKDRSVSARGDEFGIVVCARRNKTKTAEAIK
jgi:hypothetical protein